MKTKSISIIILALLMQIFNSCSKKNSIVLEPGDYKIVINNPVPKEKIILQEEKVRTISFKGTKDTYLLKSFNNNYVLLDKNRSKIYKYDNQLVVEDSLLIENILEIDHDISEFYPAETSYKLYSKKTKVIYETGKKINKSISEENISQLKANKLMLSFVATELFLRKNDIEAKKLLKLNGRPLYTFEQSEVNKNNLKKITYTLSDSLLFYKTNNYPFNINTVDFLGRSVNSFLLLDHEINLEDKNLKEKYYNKSLPIKKPGEIYALNNSWQLVKFQSEQKSEDPKMKMQINNEYYSYYLFKKGYFQNTLFIENIEGDIKIIKNNQLVAIASKEDTIQINLYNLKLIKE